MDNEKIAKELVAVAKELTAASNLTLEDVLKNGMPSLRALYELIEKTTLRGMNSEAQELRDDMEAIYKGLGKGLKYLDQRIRLIS